MKVRLSDPRGQSLIEFTMFLPLALVLCFGMIELGYALLDQHVVSKLTREGSNLISRYTTIEDASTGRCKPWVRGRWTSTTVRR